MIRQLCVYALFLLFGLTVGGLTAIWFFWPLCLIIVPTAANRIIVGSLTISYERVIGLSSLLVLLTTTGRAVLPRFRFLDGVVIAMMMCDAISLTSNMGFRPLAVIQYPLYYIAYLIGRFYLRSTDDLPRAVGGMAAVLILGSGLALLEATTRIQPIWILASGHGSPDATRFGLMRTRLGCCGPISLGTTVLLMLPWAMEAARLARHGAGPGWWRFAPPASVMVLIATMSRGPILVSFICPVINLYFRRPRLRQLLVGATLGVAILGYAFSEQLIEFVHSMVSQGDTTSTVIIEGKVYAYNGTAHRKLLYLVYREPMRQAGAFGFDANWPPLNPPSLAFYFFSVDNAYIAMRMRRGYVGLLMFDMLLVGTVLAAWRMAKCDGHPMAPVAERVVACMAALILALFTVDIFPETRAMLLMTAGFAAWLEDSREAYLARSSEAGWPDDDNDDYDDIWLPDGVA